MASVTMGGRGSFLRTPSLAVLLVLASSCVAPKEAPSNPPSDTTPDAAEAVPTAGASVPNAAPSSPPPTDKPPTPTAEGQEPEVWPTAKPKPVSATAEGQEPEVWPAAKPNAAPPPAPPASDPSLAGVTSAAPTDAKMIQAGSSIPIHGSLSSQYRGRWADSQHDNDLYEFLAVDYGDASKDKWTAHLSARMSVDLDGKPPSSTPPLFFGLADTYDSAVNTRLYEAHLDGTDIGPLAELKFGRQIDNETPVYAWFDGLYLQSKPIGDHKLDFGAYGGVPVYMYESSTSGDVQAGAFAESKLWSQAKGRLDYMYLEDTISTGYHSDSLWRLGLWQDVGQRLHFEGNYSRLNDHNRDWAVRANYTQPEDDLTMQAAFYQLLEGQVNLALPIDPFSTSLGELFPYYDASFLISKGFGPKWNLQAGFDARRVTEEADIGNFNHNFNRYFLTAVMSNVLPTELVLSVTGEVWNGGSNGIASCGADLSRRFIGKLDGSIGTFYSLYQTDLFSNTERDNVRTYYLRLRYHPGPSLTWDLRYEYESVDVGPFNTLVLGLVWHF